MTTTAATKRHNYFSDTVLENPEAFIRRARRDLKGIEFDAFVVRGMSGAIAGAMLSRSMKKGLYVVRKDDDDTHDTAAGFGIVGERYVFLDDFISTGRTFWETYNKLRKQLSSIMEWRQEGGWDSYPMTPPSMVGAYLYRDEKFRNNVEFQAYLQTRTEYGAREYFNSVLAELD